MPILTRWFIKTSLVCFIAALILGIAQAAQGVVRLPAELRAAAPAYVHLLVVGWITQLIFGVAYWMFPKLSAETPRGSDRLGLTAYGSLNLGLLLRVVAEPLHTIHASPGLGWTLMASAVLQWLAGLAFVLNTWSRVKER
jgi:hypothetical protein